MVGLVIVSHSRALARAAATLAAEMVPDRPVPLEVAAGLDDTTFGTDAVAITEAIAAADQGDGVVVLMDLGSAVLSAELALDLLDDDLRERVVLTAAPLVEGLIAATVAAAGEATREEVAVEAAAALTGKQAHLGPAGPPHSPGATQPTGPPAGPPEGGPSATVAVVNAHGLHARPAARLVTQVRLFDAATEIRNATTGSDWVPAASLSRVATLGVLQGHQIEVRASGPQAAEAVDAVIALANRAFDETHPAPAEGPVPAPAGQPPPSPDAGLSGRAASPGIGIGPARHVDSAEPEIPGHPSQGFEREWRRVEDALSTVREELHRTRAAVGNRPEADIFDAHLLLLDDTDLLDDVRSRTARGSPAPQAWADAAARIAAEFDGLPDPYLKARASDVRAVRLQVLRVLLGAAATTVPADGVVIAADLAPADAAGLDPSRIAGILLAAGSPTSHGAILARTRGIPAVVAVGPALLAIPEGTTVALDGATGEVRVEPPEPVLASLRKRAAAQASRRTRALSRASEAAETRDGVLVGVGANVGSVADAITAAECGADLAGLIRTEFLFLGRDRAPGVDEQEAVYRQIATALDRRRLTIRTLDVGGDKPLPYAPAAAEDNPFLGVRGIRHSLAHPSLLAAQLLAIVRVAHDVPVNVMFPMVSTVDELLAARRMLDEAVTRAGRGAPPGLKVGIMTEVPAAALKAATFAPHVDFFSVGTNDLTQYALAAERGNPALASLADGLDPGVLRLVDAVCRGAGDRVSVSVCGELAADVTAVPLLAGLGVRELSVAPPMIPEVKQAVRDTDTQQAAAMAARALDLADAAAVRAAL
ncbi:phosphoenolpyruvate--protein phosphotransferase [Actinoplanes sp. NPDC049548]|uniref:phosphoenolpyruvate--protein phosphotransferase n=1 Tax=Actinoplanes sp. NPDC049548 TaxID=3155152 RepID=UPI0034421E60